MRKFVIKNRPKRKYTKKIVSTSTSSLSKALYEMLPLLIIVIAFMATIIISLPFRESLTKIRFSLQIPQFSLTNPLTFIQTLLDDVSQIVNQIGFLLSLIVASLYHTTAAIGNGTINTLTLLNPLPFFIEIGNSVVFIGSLLQKGILFIFSGLTFTYTTSLQAEMAILSVIISFVVITIPLINSAITTAAVFTIQLFTSIGQITGTMVNSLLQAIFSALKVTVEMIGTLTTHSVQIIIYSLEICFQVILLVIKSIVSLITFIMTAIFAFIAQVITAIVHVIEIPFKILYAFWLVIKPYVDILLHHMQMTGTAFSEGVTDINNLITGFSSSK